MNLESRLEKLLKQHGLRITRPRQLVFEFLINAKEPVKLRQVIALHGVWADRASLYRTVKLFQELGIIKEVHRSGGAWLELGETFSGHHHHITCSGCGITQNVTSAKVEAQLDEIARQAGYSVIDHQFEITGCCPDCLALAASKQVSA